MFKTIFKFFSTKIFFGGLIDVVKSNFVLILFPLLLLISIFYVPYEYFNYLEFKNKYPNDFFGVNFILIRPYILIIVSLYVIISINRKIKFEEKKKIEKIKQEEEERLEKLKLAREKLEQFKSTKPIKIAEKAITKPIVGAGAGAALGAVAGGTLGVAGKLAGVMIAVNGGWILAPIGAALGYLGIKAFSKKDKKD
jgi:hypothetical protein